MSYNLGHGYQKQKEPSGVELPAKAVGTCNTVAGWLIALARSCDPLKKENLGHQIGV
jgi:hypothetical protein